MELKITDELVDLHVNDELTDEIILEKVKPLKISEKKINGIIDRYYKGSHRTNLSAITDEQKIFSYLILAFTVKGLSKLFDECEDYLYSEYHHLEKYRGVNKTFSGLLNKICNVYKFFYYNSVDVSDIRSPLYRAKQIKEVENQFKKLHPLIENPHITYIDGRYILCGTIDGTEFALNTWYAFDYENNKERERASATRVIQELNEGIENIYIPISSALNKIKDSVDIEFGTVPEMLSDGLAGAITAIIKTKSYDLCITYLDYIRLCQLIYRDLPGENFENKLFCYNVPKLLDILSNFDEYNLLSYSCRLKISLDVLNKKSISEINEEITKYMLGWKKSIETEYNGGFNFMKTPKPKIEILNNNLIVLIEDIYIPNSLKNELPTFEDELDGIISVEYTEGEI